MSRPSADRHPLPSWAGKLYCGKSNVTEATVNHTGVVGKVGLTGQLTFQGT